MGAVKTRDSHPAIMVKHGILARSGVYLYSYDEMLQRGFKPPVKKDFYREYRPAHVLIRAKDKFAFTTMTVEHTAEETNPKNFRSQASGIIGENIEVTTLDNGEVALSGNIAFYTQDAADYYNAGHKETSADYRSKVVLSKNPEYDLELVEIMSVNGVVLTERGRGGPSVRVTDSARPQNNIGGLKMKKGVLGFLGIGRAKDEANFRLSQVVMSAVKQVHTLDAAGVSKSVEDVMSHITCLSESDTREILIGAVRDSFSHPVEAVAKEKEVSDIIDKLYARCRDADDAELKKTMDGLLDKGEDGDDDEDDESKKKKADEAKTKDTATIVDESKKKKADEAKTKDTATIVEEAIAKSVKPLQDELKRVNDSISATVDAAVAKALGVSGGKGKDDAKGGDSRTVDGASGNIAEDAAFLLDGVFGSK
jgi:hypothetical protein